MSEHSKSKGEQPNGKHVVPKKFTMPKSFIQGSKPKPEKLSDKEKIIKSNYFIRETKKETPFYKTGISRSPFNFGDFTETGPGRTKKQNESEVTSHTEENNASLGRSTRQRKIDNLKGTIVGSIKISSNSLTDNNNYDYNFLGSLENFSYNTLYEKEEFPLVLEKFYGKIKFNMK